MSWDDWKLTAWIVWRLKFPLVVGAAFAAGTVYAVVMSDGPGLLDPTDTRQKLGGLLLFSLGGFAGMVNAWLFAMECWGIIKDAERAEQEGDGA